MPAASTSPPTPMPIHIIVFPPERAGCAPTGGGTASVAGSASSGAGIVAVGATNGDAMGRFGADFAAGAAAPADADADGPGVVEGDLPATERASASPSSRAFA